MSLGNSMFNNTLSISRHARALCLGVNPLRRDATCSPNELASSLSAVRCSIWETSNLSRLSTVSFFFLRLD